MPAGKNPFILIIAISSGVLAFFLTFRAVGRDAPAVAPVNSPEAVVAVRDITMGTMIRQDDLELMPAPGNVKPKQIFSEISNVMGKVVRRNILKGEVLKKVDLLEEGDNLAALIPRGYRAMTVPVSLSDSIGDMLQIGNRVDILLTYEVSRGDIKSLTLVENARVIGISKRNSSRAGRRGADITLAVTPEGAETLAFAMKRGTLNISIRSFAEEGQEKFFTLKELFFPDKEKEAKVAEILQIEKPKLPKDVVEIIRGVDKERFATDWQS